jgi:hypothetical protein
MTVIEHEEVGSGGAASIAFTAIPATFTDLYLVCSLRSSLTSGYAGLSINGSTANFSSRLLAGTGSGALSFSYTSATVTYPIFNYIDDTNDTANTFHSACFLIPNYTSSNAKSISIDSVFENNGTTAYQQIAAGLWNDTDAITSLTLVSANSGLDASGNFVQYSSATLYGITAGSSGGVTVS